MFTFVQYWCVDWKEKQQPGFLAESEKKTEVWQMDRDVPEVVCMCVRGLGAGWWLGGGGGGGGGGG